MSTHNYLSPNGDRAPAWGNDDGTVDPTHNNPERVWDKLISRQDQIFLVLCGHRPETAARRVDRNRFGHQVFQLLSDYQDRWQAAKDAGIKEESKGLGDGWMRLMTFSMSSPVPMMRVRTYSAHYRRFSSDLPQYAAWYKPANVADDEYDFSLELSDFRVGFGEPQQ